MLVNHVQPALVVDQYEPVVEVADNVANLEGCLVEDGFVRVVAR